MLHKRKPSQSELEERPHKFHKLHHDDGSILEVHEPEENDYCTDVVDDFRAKRKCSNSKPGRVLKTVVGKCCVCEYSVFWSHGQCRKCGHVACGLCTTAQDPSKENIQDEYRVQKEL